MNEPKLSFVGIGPQRTASTWLYEALLGHPAVCFPKDVKETMFFDLRFDKGMPWYWSHFKHHVSTQKLGEVAPTYFDQPEACARIRAHNPACQIIINVRNPVTRAFSLYRHHLAKGRVSGSFRDAVRQMPRIIDAGRFSVHCPCWEQAFGKDRVLYLCQEEIEKEPATILESVSAFLGIEARALPARGKSRVNAGTVPRHPALAKMAAALVTQLHGLRLHGLVAFGKRLGLQRVYSGGSSDMVVLTPGDYDAAVADYEADIRYIEQRLGRSFAVWRQFQRGG